RSPAAGAGALWRVACAGPGPAPRGRLAGDRRAARLRALPGAGRRPLARRHGLLQRQRLHRPDRPGLRRHRTPPLTSARAPAPVVRAMFTRIAGRYDLMNSLMTAGRHHAWRLCTARAAIAAPPGAVLDLATGTADLALALRTLAPGRLVVVAGFSEGLLPHGRANGVAA